MRQAGKEQQHHTEPQQRLGKGGSNGDQDIQALPCAAVTQVLGARLHQDRWQQQQGWSLAKWGETKNHRKFHCSSKVTSPQNTVHVLTPTGGWDYNHTVSHILQNTYSWDAKGPVNPSNEHWLQVSLLTKALHSSHCTGIHLWEPELLRDNDQWSDCVFMPWNVSCVWSLPQLGGGGKQKQKDRHTATSTSPNIVSVWVIRSWSAFCLSGIISL